MTDLADFKTPNVAQTENDMIYPLLENLKRAYHGPHLNLCLHYLNAIAAGDPDAMIVI